MDSFQNIANYTSSFFSKNSLESLISNDELIRIGDILQGFQSNTKIDVPNIIVVGTQSSGKSSVLNSLIGLEVLPTGKQMVTRTPLKLEIIRSYNPNDETILEIGEYGPSGWVSSIEQSIHFPTPTEQEQNIILSEIEKQTNRKAGNLKDVSDEMIFIRIKSPKVINLSLIDLPGLTAVACTDQGQPQDIKYKIEKVIETYASSSSSLILSILPGRSDLEADYGLEFVKKMDPEGQRTIGVLTKLDLMNDEGDIVKYLLNNVSKDLQLKYGYFAVKNRSSKEKLSFDIQESLERESKYFEGHAVFKQDKFRDQLGHSALRKFLSCLLAEKVKTQLPSIQISLDKQLQEVKEELRELGTPIPESDEGKISFVQNLIFHLCNTFSHHILKSALTARNIRDIFIHFRKTTKENNYYKIHPLSNEEINEVIQNTEGNHMNFPFPPIDVIETCLQDKEKRPIFQYYDIIKTCNIEITNELTKLIDHLLGQSSISRFHHLKELIRTEACSSIIMKYSTECDKELKHQVAIQECYIWTDNNEFKEQLKRIQQDQTNIIDAIKHLLYIYLESVGEYLNDIIPKTIMYYLIHNSIDDLYSHLNSCILKQDITKLLGEDKEIESRRKWLVMREHELISIQKELLLINYQ